ncbi:MAG TPA: regulatory protein RecX [Candidatus Acidoferrales bacterium]|nr:regulatory protein RecX [Candidatus Acidoferrales bacterium]
MRPPRKLSPEDELYRAALRALMRRAHSVSEMREALERRAAEKAAVPRVLQRLQDEKLLEDAHYALQFARYRAESRRQGRYRITRELRKRGVPDCHIEAALEEVFATTDEARLLRKRLERRLGQLRGGLDERQIALLYRSLVRAGFSTDLIRAELRKLTKQDLARVGEGTLAEDDP